MGTRNGDSGGERRKEDCIIASDAGQGWEEVGFGPAFGKEGFLG